MKPPPSSQKKEEAEFLFIYRLLLSLNQSVFCGCDFIEIRASFSGFLSFWAISVSCWVVFIFLFPFFFIFPYIAYFEIKK